MYIYFRCLNLALSGKHDPSVDYWDEIVRPTRVMPTDIDVFMEMNNGRYLTLFDIGRFEYGFKIGLVKALKRRNWGLAVAGTSIRYRKRLHMFQKITMHTRVIAIDEKWTYFQQVMKRDGEWCAAALVRTAVTNKYGVVPNREVTKELGIEYEERMPDWVAKWAESDEMRPWGDDPGQKL